MSEWLKETGCKPVGYAYAGSNPAPPIYFAAIRPRTGPGALQGPRTKVPWQLGPGSADASPRHAPQRQGNPMSLSRQMIVAGLAALSLTAGASPAMAKGGGDINNA